MLRRSSSSVAMGARSQVRGVSLIELTVAIAIAALAMVMVLPSISGYFQSAKLRGAAQTYFSGAQAARAEAIRRNASVEFVLASVPVSASNVGTVALNTAAQNWAVRLPPVAPATAYQLIETKSVDEGKASSVVLASSATSVTFNGLGMASAGMTINFSNPAGGDCVSAGGPMRCLRLVVSSGGQVRLCDPAAVAPDSRSC